MLIVQLKDNYSILTILMSRFQDLPFNSFKPKWQWSKVNSKLLTNYDGKHQLISLTPNVAFQDVNQEGKKTKLQVVMSIDVEKSLPYDSFVGWSWHKSSNLPPITIKIQLQDPLTKKQYPLPDNLEARMYAIKIQLNQQGNQKATILQDVGLKGLTEFQLREQYAIFDGIRFQTTSYINQGVNFHLIILLHSKNSAGSITDILSCVMSPPIFVDSRKSARDYFQKRYISYADAFHPSLMQRQFLKKSTKDKNQNQIKIQNSFQGLYNYLTAPNIRHKVKHPLLLCVKFSNIFKVFLNLQSEQFKQNSFSLENIITKLQKTLLTEIGRERKTKKISTLVNKPFLVTIMDKCTNPKKLKIYQCLEFLNCNSIQFIKQTKEVGPNYKNVLQIGDVVSKYKEIYHKLKEMSMMQIHSRQVSDDEQEGSIVQEQQQHSKKGSFKNTVQIEEITSKKRTFSQDRRTQLNTYNEPPWDLNCNNKLSNVENKQMINPLSLQSIQSSFSANDQTLQFFLHQISLQNVLLQNMILQNQLLKQRYVSNLLNNLGDNILQKQFPIHLQRDLINNPLRLEPNISASSLLFSDWSSSRKI